jgi:hypothetical protein
LKCNSSHSPCITGRLNKISLETSQSDSILVWMTRTQFWLLNIVSAVLIVFLVAHVVISRSNNKAAQQLNTQRGYINNARQIQPGVENLVRRINAAGQNDIQLKALLSKYDIKMNPPTAETNSVANPK